LAGEFRDPATQLWLSFIFKSVLITSIAMILHCI
jgi:hypothetical protein